MKWLCSALLALSLGACTVVPSQSPTQAPSQTGSATQVSRPDANTAVRNFVTVVEDVEPVAERICRERTQGIDCDFQIAVDDRLDQPPNAFQTVNDRGRPLLVFNVALIADVANRDEIAFIMGHEAAHHIRNHLPRQQQQAVRGAIVFGVLAELSGAGAAGVRRAQEVGAGVGARSYSKEHELEADALGTVIAHRAGYDPVKGSDYFNRLPDPGNVFLGSHPPNAQRIEIVRRTAAGL